ncbi:MAG: hypothetical protein ACWGN7_06100 [Thermodesulfovibrionales bacterium]
MTLLSFIRERYLVLIPIVAMVSLAILFGISMRHKGAYESALSQYREMEALGKSYLAMRDDVLEVERRMGLSHAESIPVIVEQLMGGMGLKGKLKSVKPFGGGTRETYVIQEAEVLTERLSLNELVNVLYAIQSAPFGLFVTSCEVTRDFSERTLLDAKLSLRLIGLKAEASQ